MILIATADYCGIVFFASVSVMHAMLFFLSIEAFTTFSIETLPLKQLLSADIDVTYGDSDAPKENNSKKRGRSESCALSSSNACREKTRRDRLNDKFMELSGILEPGRTPKTDKEAILSDALRMMTVKE